MALPLAAALALALPHPGIARGTGSRSAASTHRVYFWGNVAEPVRAPGQRPQQEMIRPSTIIMYADGSWAIGHLRWKGWGSRVAHARGVSAASNGVPNVAEGKVIRRPARVTLSHRRRFHGREVYGCFTLTVAHRARQHMCLRHKGHSWLLLGSRP